MSAKSIHIQFRHGDRQVIILNKTEYRKLAHAVRSHKAIIVTINAQGNYEAGSAVTPWVIKAQDISYISGGEPDWATSKEDPGEYVFPEG
jgi:hypothetical protein